MTTEADFDRFIESIPQVTRRGCCSLRDCVRDSAMVNASDTVHVEREAATEAFWEIALLTARMIADDWQSYYPELTR